MLEDIKNLGLAEALHLIVDHGLAHDLIYITLGTLDALGLDKVVDIGTLLLILLFINGDESQTSLEPKIIVINIREENLVVVGWVDVGNLKFTRYIDCHIVYDACFCLGEGEGINNIQLVYQFLASILLGLLIAYLALEPCACTRAEEEPLPVPMKDTFVWF